MYACTSLIVLEKKPMEYVTKNKKNINQQLLRYFNLMFTIFPRNVLRESLGYSQVEKNKEQRNCIRVCVSVTTIEFSPLQDRPPLDFHQRKLRGIIYRRGEARTESHYRGSRYLHNIKARNETAKLVLWPFLAGDERRRCRKSARAGRHSWGSSRRQRNGFSPCKRSASRRTLVMGPRRFLTGLEARPTVTYTGPATCQAGQNPRTTARPPQTD